MSAHELTHISELIPPLMEQIEALRRAHLTLMPDDEPGQVTACDPDFWPEVAV